LKPLLRRVWAPIDRRPVAVVRHRFVWRYVVGFVHPASGRTVFHLATSVNIPLFEAELAAFARTVGAGPTKRIVLVLDRAGWHTSTHLTVPDHVHLLFLPPYSPDFTPIEQAFSKIKAILRGLGARTREALWEAMRVAVEAITPEDAIAWFAHAGYALPAQAN
jgi:transposase